MLQKGSKNIPVSIPVSFVAFLFFSFFRQAFSNATRKALDCSFYAGRWAERKLLGLGGSFMNRWHRQRAGLLSILNSEKKREKTLNDYPTPPFPPLTTPSVLPLPRVIESPFPHFLPPIPPPLTTQNCFLRIREGGMALLAIREVTERANVIGN